jgi:exosortase/archaeosortase family protein
MVLLPREYDSPPAIATLWSVFAIISLVLVLWLVSATTYFEFDAFGIWILSCIAILYLSRKPMESLSNRWRNGVIILGIGIVLFSFISMPVGFTRPPYSIGEFTILLSGLGLIVFGILGLSSFLLPVSIPFIAVAGYSSYGLFMWNLDWITAPLIPVTTSISVFLLNLIGINTVVQHNVFTFMSMAGDPISLAIVSDCTGITSLGTFTVSALIVLFCFPVAITRKSMGLLIIGYIGTYAANILRIILIALSGYYFGPVGVMEHVHVNIGWIVFSLWMIIFWYYFFTRQIGIQFFKKNKM